MADPFTENLSPVTGTPGQYTHLDLDYSSLPYRDLAMMGARRQSLLFQVPSLSQMASIQDEGFDPFADDFLQGYEQYGGRFIGITSKDHATKIKQQIDQETREQGILAHAGFKGFAAETTGAMMNPSTFVPFAGAASRAQSIGQNAARIGGAVGLEEMVLQAAQTTRTKEESFMGIASSTALAGLFSAFMPHGTRMSPESQAEIKRMVDEEWARIRDEELSAAKPDDIFAEEGRVVPPDEPRRAENLSAGGVGAETPSPRAQRAQEDLLSAAWMEKIPDNPLKRTLNSAELRVREIAQQLVESPYFLRKHTQGTASEISVEAGMRQWNWPLVETVNKIDQLYMGYRGKRKTGIGANMRQDLEDMIQGRGDFVSRETFREEVGKALRNGDEHDIPEVQQAAQFIRSKILDPMGKEAKDMGLFSQRLRDDLDGLKAKFDDATDAKHRERLRAQIEEVRKAIDEVDNNVLNPKWDKSYFPRFWRHDYIIENYDEFQDALRAHFAKRGMPAEKIDEAVQETTETILREKPYHAIDDDAVGIARATRERTLDIESKDFEKFLENDAEAIMRYYVRTLSADIELARKFGRNDMRDQIAEIEKNYHARISATKTREAKEKLRKQMNADLRDLRAMRDRVRGTYGLPDDPYRNLSRFYRAAKQFNYLTMLGGVAVSSIPDIARIAMADGLGRAFKHGFRPFISRVEGLKLMRREAQMAGTALEMALGHRALAFAELGDVFGRHSRFERFLTGSTSAFSLINLFNPWNAAMKEMAANVVSAQILRVSKEWAEGSIKQGDIERMARAGIDEPMAQRIAKQYAAHGEEVDGLHMPNTEAWDDLDAVHAFRTAMAQDVDRVIVTPGAGDRPLWMSTELGSVIGQFKSFGVSSAQRVLMAGLQQKDQQFFMGVAMMVGMGMMVDRLKQLQYGNSRERSMTEHILEGIDRSGVIGYFADINRTVEKLSDNTLGLHAMFGVAPPYKNSFRTKVGSVAGPTADQIARAGGVFTDIVSGSYDYHTAGALRRLIPLHNVPWLDGGFDAIEKGLRF